MTAPVSTNTVKSQKSSKAEDHLEEREYRAPAMGPTYGLLALQRAAGNHAVSELFHQNHDSSLPQQLPDQVSNGGGQPLDSQAREHMERRFGQDFSNVRVHTDSQAEESASQVNAKAYTIGNSIVFGRGRYAPQTSDGKGLIAHELAHVVQQSRGGGIAGPAESNQLEAVADRATKTATSGSSGNITVVGAAAPSIMRQPDDPDEPVKSTQPGQPANVGPQKAMTPEEILDEHVFGPRVHEEIGDLRARLKAQEAKLAKSPNDPTLQKQVAAMRQQLSVLEGKGLDPKQTGVSVPGHGRINTRAAIQIVGPDGQIIAVERGSWHADRHAEEDALQKLRKRLGGKKLPPGTRMNVAGNQYVCSDVCKPAVSKFAQDYGIDPANVDATVRTRPKMRTTGQASPKTTERTGLRQDVPKGQVKTEPLFPTSANPPQGNAATGAQGGKTPAAQANTPKAQTPAGAPTGQTPPASTSAAKGRTQAGASASQPAAPVATTPKAGAPAGQTPSAATTPPANAPTGTPSTQPLPAKGFNATAFAGSANQAADFVSIILAPYIFPDAEEAYQKRIGELFNELQPKIDTRINALEKQTLKIAQLEKTSKELFINVEVVIMDRHSDVPGSPAIPSIRLEDMKLSTENINETKSFGGVKKALRAGVAAQTEKYYTYSLPVRSEIVQEVKRQFRGVGAFNLKNFNNLVNELSASSDRVRISAAIGVYKFGKGIGVLREPAIQQLIPLLRDEKGSVRVLAATTLRGLGATEAIPSIRQALKETGDENMNKIIQRNLDELEKLQRQSK